MKIYVNKDERCLNTSCLPPICDEGYNPIEVTEEEWSAIQKAEEEYNKWQKFISRKVYGPTV
jgi:hypothetical protein